MLFLVYGTFYLVIADVPNCISIRIAILKIFAEKYVHCKLNALLVLAKCILFNVYYQLVVRTFIIF